MAHMVASPSLGPLLWYPSSHPQSQQPPCGSHALLHGISPPSTGHMLTTPAPGSNMAPVHTSAGSAFPPLHIVIYVPDILNYLPFHNENQSSIYTIAEPPSSGSVATIIKYLDGFDSTRNNSCLPKMECQRKNKWRAFELVFSFP